MGDWIDSRAQSRDENARRANEERRLQLDRINVITARAPGFFADFSKAAEGVADKLDRTFGVELGGVTHKPTGDGKQFIVKNGDSDQARRVRVTLTVGLDEQGRQITARTAINNPDWPGAIGQSYRFAFDRNERDDVFVTGCIDNTLSTSRVFHTGEELASALLEVTFPADMTDGRRRQ
jgi:hypothetical protein